VMHEQLAREAVELVMPAIYELLDRYAKRKDLHIVVMDPRVKPWEGSFDEAVLHERSVGDSSKWKDDYRRIARSKAKQAWRDGQANIITQMLAPATLKNGDTVFWGSFEYYGVIVAASGIESWFDMLVSAWVATALQQLAQHKVQQLKTEHPNAGFLPT